MSRCALDTTWPGYAHAVLVLVCNLPRVAWKYGDRGYRFAHVDAGVLVQNLTDTPLPTKAQQPVAKVADPARPRRGRVSYTERHGNG